VTVESGLCFTEMFPGIRFLLRLFFVWCFGIRVCLDFFFSFEVMLISFCVLFIMCMETLVFSASYSGFCLFVCMRILRALENLVMSL
jgi:hypothetical protein